MSPSPEPSRTFGRVEPLDLDQSGWEQVFRSATVPMFVQDISQLRKAIAEVKAQGDADFATWIDAHPDFFKPEKGAS